jgi:hypothetical protein
MDGLPDLPPPTMPVSAPPAVPLPPTAPFPAPFTTEPTVSVVIHEPPKRRRTGLLIAGAALVVATLGVGGTLLLLRDDDPADATYSLTEAADQAASATSVAFTMTVDMLGQRVVAEAETDTVAGLTHLSMNLGDAGLGVDSTIEMLSDANAKVIYMKSAFFDELGMDVDTDWIKMDAEFLSTMGGADGGLFGSASWGNPLDAAPLFAAAESVTDLGFDEVDGVRVKHYEVVVDTAAALATSPQIQQAFDDTDGELPKDLTYDVYVDEQNQIRRTATTVKAGATKVTADIVITPLTEPLHLELPDPGDVTDMSDLI